jgi:hypothetical protein
MILLQSGNDNFFGGEVQDQPIILYNKMNGFKGKIGYLLDDPEIPLVNIPKAIKDKPKYSDRLSQDAVDYWNKIYPKIKIFYGGVDYSKIKDEYASTREIEYWPIVEFTVANSYDSYTPTYGTKGKEYDFMYFGKIKRKKILNNFINNDTKHKKLFVGYDPELPNTTVMGAVHIDKLPFLIEKAWFNLVLGSKLHNDNFVALRLFQSLAYNSFAFILHDFDTKKHFIRNKELQKLMYVKTYQDIIERADYIKQNFERLIELQRAEIEPWVKRFRIQKLQNLNGHSTTLF